MFNTLLASNAGTGSWVRPALAAVALHFLIVVSAVHRTAASPASSRLEVRDTIRLELGRLSESEPQRGTQALPPGIEPAIPAPPPPLSSALDLLRLEPIAAAAAPIDLSALARATSAGPSDGSSTGGHSSGSALDPTEVDQPPELVEDFHLRYPEALRQTAVSGVVQLEYVIDPTGRVDAGSIRILWSTHPAFSHAAREAVRDARFKPARRAGHAVAVLARQTIRFVSQ